MLSATDSGARWVCLPATAESPYRSRQFVREALLEWSLRDLLDDATLLVSELTSNALMHAHTPMVVGASWSPAAGVLRISVHDDDGAHPVVRHPDAHATSGRGLEILEHVASRWGVTHENDGKVVWFELHTAA